MRRFLTTLVVMLSLCANAWSATITVATVADLATARPGDGDVITTLGYTVAGTGANTYRYDADSAATANGGTVIAGPGSVGRYIAIDQKTANADQFGAVGDGSTNDTTALQAWIDAYDNGARLFVLAPNKTYIVNSKVVIDQMTDFVVDLNGSTIKCGAASPVDANGQALHITRCDRFEVRNGVVDGNRDNRGTPAQVPAHNIGIYDCDDFVLNRITSKNAVVDGFYLDEYTPGSAPTTNHRGVFSDCIADNNVRQGMSVIAGHDITISGGEYTGTNGLSPSAGIDLEADAGTASPAISGVIIDGVNFEGNWGSSIQISSVQGARDTIIRNCKLTGTNTEATVTFSLSPDNLVNATGHSFEDGMGVVFRTTNTLPTGLSVQTQYYVVNATANTFQVSTTEGGAAVALSGSPSGTHTVGWANGGIASQHSCVVDGCVIRNVISLRSAIDIAASTDGKARIVNNRFYSCSPSYRYQACVYVHGSSGGKTIIANNYAEGCNGFCDVNAGYVIVANNVVDTPTKTYANLAAVGSNARGCKLIGNTVLGGYLNTIYSDCDSEDMDLSIIGNSIINPTGVGDNVAYGTIRVADDNALIASNIITLDSAQTSATAIYVDGNNCLIDGNKIVGYSTTTPINVVAAKASRITESNVPMNVVTLTSLDATPSIRGSSFIKTANAGATTVTALDDGVAGHVVTVFINDANTTVDFTGTTLKGNNGVDWVPASGDHMTCTFDGTNWLCNVSEN